MEFLHRHFWKIWVAWLVMIIAVWAGLFVGGYLVAKYVSDAGLKEVVERVWEGPEG